jgi:hypothetical protein
METGLRNTRGKFSGNYIGGVLGQYCGRSGNCRSG